MTISFFKYEGAGNDFILIDNRKNETELSAAMISAMCRRHFGIGADGLIMLEEDPAYDFSMRYFNADGREATLCGNGGRCVVAFARRLGLIDKKTVFSAADGVHHAQIISSSGKTSVVSLQMHDIGQWEKQNEDYIINTGSPHLVRFVEECSKTDVVSEGRKIRYSPPFRKSGINVNFVSVSNDTVEMRTYERGVEDETLACGTGAVAVALAVALRGKESPVTLNARGGELKVNFRFDGNRFTDIRLEGPATFVFEGIINIGEEG